MKKPNEHLARLVVRGLNELSEQNWFSLISWLRRTADDIEKSEPLDWSKISTFKLYKVTKRRYNKKVISAKSYKKS